MKNNTLFKKITIEGKELTVYHLSIKRGGNQYCVYENKIWNIVSSTGSGNSHTKLLERKLNKETILLDYEKLNDILYITRPTGFIAV